MCQCVCNDEFRYEKDTNMTDMNWSEDMQHQKPKMMDDSIMQSRKPDLTDVTGAVYDHLILYSSLKENPLIHKLQSKSSFYTCFCQGNESWCLVSDKWCWHSSLCPTRAAGRCTATTWQQREKEARERKMEARDRGCKQRCQEEEVNDVREQKGDK